MLPVEEVAAPVLVGEEVVESVCDPKRSESEDNTFLASASIFDSFSSRESDDLRPMLDFGVVLDEETLLGLVLLERFNIAEYADAIVERFQRKRRL